MADRHDKNDKNDNDFSEDISTEATASLTLSQLRDLAQDHLRSIEAEDSTEAEAQLQSQAELQKYTKMKRKGQPRSNSPGQAALASSASAANLAAGHVGNAEMTKGPRLRSAGDVLDRLKWDPSVRMDEYIIGYLERFEGIMEMPAVNWIKESTDEDFIPQHRIKWVKRRTESGEQIIWDRELRIDRLFGTGSFLEGQNLPATAESTADSADGGAVV